MLTFLSTGKMSHNKSSAQTAKNKARLQALLLDPHNRFCSDCKVSRNPRWASWNLGVFICIRCSGIHRSLGTHISRVKSVDLDSWTDEQTANMESWGNQKANAYWESKLFEMDANKGHHTERGDGYVPIDGKVDSFVRTKYCLGKWKKDTDRDAFAKSGKPSSNNSSAESMYTTSSQQQQQNQKQQVNLLDDILGNSSRVEKSRFQSNTPVAQVNKSKVNPTVDLLKQTTNTAGTTSNISSNSNSSSNTAISNSNFNAKSDLKKNILSLYSTPTSSNFNLQQQQPQQQRQSFPIASTMMQSSVSSTVSVNGSANSSTSNVWSTNTNANTSNNNVSRGYINDDPFKNVWQ